MSSVSSYDGSEKELFHQRTLDGFIPRQSYLRKTDYMDNYDTARSSSRDTDTWSVAATVDDQESVISSTTQKSRFIPDIDDDNLTVDTTTLSISNHNYSHNDNNNNGDSSDTNSYNNNTENNKDEHNTRLSSSHHRRYRDNNNDNNNSNNNDNSISLDLNGHSLAIDSLDMDTITDDDKYERSLTSRSVAAEYGDRTTDGFGSEVSLIHDDEDDDDNDNGLLQHHHHHHHHRLHEDDDNQSHSTHGQLDNDDEVHDDDHCQRDQLAHNDDHHHRKHRHRRHMSSRSPVAVDDAILAPTEPQPSIATIDKTYTHLMEENEMLQAQLRHLEITTKQQQEIIANMQSHHHHHQTYDDLLHGELNSSILSQQLATWAELVAGFAQQWTTSLSQQLQVEQDLFHHVMEYYLDALPFGTENQVLLNTAYQDQLARFNNTLGMNFAKWYRRQTVQSLARNPATHDYLHVVRVLITQHICRILEADSALLTESTEWQTLLDHCARLSLELHSGEQDVLIRSIAPGTLYDASIMTAVDEGNGDTKDDSGNENTQLGEQRRTKCMLCPLFIDEEENVLLPARVILE